MDRDRQIVPSAFGFRSIRPRTRTERKNLSDKVQLEKTRIEQRVGWEARIHKANAPENSSMLTSCQPSAAGYLANSDRFHTDTAGEEYSVRMERYRHQQAVAETKRRQSAKRDEDRWNQAEAKQRAEDEHWQKIRDDGKKALKNKSNVAYDICTLQYDQNTDGEQQKYLDDMVRYRAALRTNDLVVKGDTRARYNIINGEDRVPRPTPAPFAKPPSMDIKISPRVDRRTSLAPYNG